MKKTKKFITMPIVFLTILLIIFNSTFLINNCFSQWIWQQSGTTSPILDVEFLNRYTGYYCGNGVIGKTTNAGENWMLLNQPATNKALHSINPVDSNILYCVGMFETILKSTNGGANWIIIRNGPWGSGHSYFASYFVNENTGWITGSGGIIFKTTDGGSTLDSFYVFDVGYIYDIYFKDSLEGVFCGIGNVHKTTNGGMNWVPANIQLYGHFPEFHKITFINNLYGWVIGHSNSVYKTTDFGSNWDSIGYVTGSSFTNCVCFSSQTTGWAGGSWGKFFKSTDSGFTWKRENTGTFTGYITSAYFYNDSVGWLVGNGGRIQHTTTSGQTLVNITSTGNRIPEKFELYQNYPNPFNNQTIFEFDIKENNIYQLAIYDCLGRLREEFLNEYLNTGSYKITYNADMLSSGVYFYRLYSPKNSVTKKFIIMK